MAGGQTSELQDKPIPPLPFRPKYIEMTFFQVLKKEGGSGFGGEGRNRDIGERVSYG